MPVDLRGVEVRDAGPHGREVPDRDVPRRVPVQRLERRRAMLLQERVHEGSDGRVELQPAFRRGFQDRGAGQDLRL